MADGHASFRGITGTPALKAFDLGAAGVGLAASEAEGEGLAQASCTIQVHPTRAWSQAHS